LLASTEGRAIGKIFVTHCSGKKDDSLCDTGIAVAPEKLYTAQPLRRFVDRCKDAEVEWAIFSDKYGLVFPSHKIKWYDKPPGKVSEQEFQKLLQNFVSRLSAYDEVWFYHNPGRFHALYKRLVTEAQVRGTKVRLFSHISEIE